MKLNKFYGAAITAFVIWGFIPFPLRSLAAYSPTQILYFRLIVSVIALLLITFSFRRKKILETLRVFKTSEKKDKRNFILFTSLGGILLTANWLTFIYVINYIDIQTASFAYLVCPIITALLGFLLLKERLNSNQWFAIGLSIISCFLLGSGSIEKLFFSLFTASTYAFYLITQRILKQYDRIILLTLQLCLSFAIIGPIYNFISSESSLLLDSDFFVNVTILSLVFTVLPLFMNLYALKELNSGSIGIFMYINPIINFVMAFLYFNEPSTPIKNLAYGLIFLSVVIYNMKFKSFQRRKAQLVK